MGYEPTPKKKLRNLYIDRVFLSDFLLGLVFVLLYKALKYLTGPILSVDLDSLKDLINELISTSLSLGGFSLAALAIIASIKDKVPQKTLEQSESGKEVFFNSASGYSKVIRTYVSSCYAYLILFLFFTVLRATEQTFEFNQILVLIQFGAVVLSSSFVRSVLILWMIINLPDKNSAKA